MATATCSNCGKEIGTMTDPSGKTVAHPCGHCGGN
jgi:DNA-directed RNA polymerase subunit RPC12/RpoP